MFVRVSGRFELAKVGMGEECKYHAHFTLRATRDILIF